MQKSTLKLFLGIIPVLFLNIFFAQPADARVTLVCKIDETGLCVSGGGSSGGFDPSNGTGQFDGKDVEWFVIQKEGEISSNCTHNGVVDPICARARSCGFVADALCYTPDNLVNNPAFDDLRNNSTVNDKGDGTYVVDANNQSGGSGGSGGSGSSGGGATNTLLSGGKAFGGRITLEIPCTGNLDPRDKLIYVSPPKGGIYLKTTSTKVYSYKSLSVRNWVLGMSSNSVKGCRIGTGIFSSTIAFGRVIQYLGTSR